MLEISLKRGSGWESKMTSNVYPGLGLQGYKRDKQDVV